MASSQLLTNLAQYFRPKPYSLKIREEISRGAYGSVHSGELDGRPVAVKRIHRLLLEGAKGQGDFDKVMTDFKEECQRLELADHPHVVDFRGAFYDNTTDEPLLVMEKMRENLRDFLERNRAGDLSRQRQLEICLGITRGLRFLHTHIPPIIHRDLTDKNIMFGKDGLVKIGDLGQSRLKANNAEYFSTAQPGAMPFMPPEAMQKQSHYNEKLDVFSLGVLMLEIATQQPPGVRPLGIGVTPEIRRRKGDLSKLEDDHPLKPLILSCFKDDPEERPNIVTIHMELQAMVEGVEEVLPQSPLPPSHGKVVHSIKLPNMPWEVSVVSATIQSSRVYISAVYNASRNRDEKYPVCCVYSTTEHKWSTLPMQQGTAAITVVNARITLIGGSIVAKRKVTKTLSTWYEEDSQWRQILPPMPKPGRCYPTVVSHNNFLLVTGGLTKGGSTVLSTTDVLDLTTMKWTTPEGLKLPIPLWWHQLTLCGEYIYLVGGATTVLLTSPEQFNSHAWRAKWSDVKRTAATQHSQPRTSVWTQIADPPTILSAAVSCGGTLYTIGGHGVAGKCKPLRGVSAYDTARNQWIPAGEMSVGRAFHCAVALNDHSVFVAGGDISDSDITKDNNLMSTSAEVLIL